MSACTLDQHGEILLHRNMQASPETFLKTITPYRNDIVVAAECVFTWDWLADLCRCEDLPFVRGRTLSGQAIHGGKANNDKIDATGLLRISLG